MGEKGRAKKNIEEGQKLRVQTASKEEAQTAATICSQLATEPEASPELRTLAAFYQAELAAPPTLENTARREAIMARWQAALARFN